MSESFLDQPFPILELEESVLRNIQPIADAPSYFQYMNHELVKEQICEDYIPNSLENSVIELSYWANLFQQKKSIYWAIANKSDNQLIGTIGFNYISFKNSKAEISYDLDPRHWGRGVMSNALLAVLYLSEHILKITRIQATVAMSNLRSVKLLEKFEFKQEGILKKYEKVMGECRDYYMYARIQ